MPNNQQPSNDNPRTYLVTGAAGFIASKVCEQLHLRKLKADGGLAQMAKQIES